eukprot:5847194-Amphidinium_carterae.1
MDVHPGAGNIVTALCGSSVGYMQLKFNVIAYGVMGNVTDRQDARPLYARTDSQISRVKWGQQNNIVSPLQSLKRDKASCGGLQCICSLILRAGDVASSMPRCADFASFTVLASSTFYLGFSSPLCSSLLARASWLRISGAVESTSV